MKGGFATHPSQDFLTPIPFSLPENPLNSTGLFRRKTFNSADFSNPRIAKPSFSASTSNPFFFQLKLKPTSQIYSSEVSWSLIPSNNSVSLELSSRASEANIALRDRLSSGNRQIVHQSQPDFDPKERLIKCKVNEKLIRF